MLKYTYIKNKEHLSPRASGVKREHMTKKTIKKILLPKELGVDEVLSLAVLHSYGKKVFTGLSKAELEFRTSLPQKNNFDYYLQKGIVPLFLLSKSYEFVLEELLMYEDLKLNQYPIVNQILSILKNKKEYACYNDSMFSWIRLIKANTEPKKVLNLILPLLKEYLEQAEEKRIQLFEECQKAIEKGKLTSFIVEQEKKKLKVVFTSCDENAYTVDDVADYLLYKKEVLGDLIVVFTNKGKISIISKKEKNIDLLDVVAILRIETARHKKIPFDKINKHVLNRNGLMDGIEYWNFDLYNRRIDAVKSVNLDKLTVKKAMLIGLDLDRVSAVCPAEEGCRGKKCAYYSYNMLRCRKRRAGVKDEHQLAEKEKRSNIRVIRK